MNNQVNRFSIQGARDPDDATDRFSNLSLAGVLMYVGKSECDLGVYRISI